MRHLLRRLTGFRVELAWGLFVLDLRADQEHEAKEAIGFGVEVQDGD